MTVESEDDFKPIFFQFIFLESCWCCYFSIEVMKQRGLCDDTYFVPNIIPWGAFSPPKLLEIIELLYIYTMCNANRKKRFEVGTKLLLGKMRYDEISRTYN